MAHVRTSMTRMILAAIGLAALGACAPQAKPVKGGDYTFFLKQLTDLDALAVGADGVYTRQFSSYDRASRYDEATGKYVNWDANGDSGHYIRIDEKTGEAVMAEMEGPGCIWRIWSANPQGKIRFYFDGAETPSYEFDFDALFAGKIDGFPNPLVWQRRVDMAKPGENNPASDCYMPIPYAKSCKVTADKPHGQYYHIGYTTCPKDWKVPTFALKRTPHEEAVLKAVCAALNNRGIDPQPMANMPCVDKDVTLKAGERVVIASLKGPATIRQFFAKLSSGERYARRKVLLQMYWDGQKEPAVEAPIGDFFGEAWKEETYRSLPLGVTNDLNYCYWRMPFAKSAEIVVVNEGERSAQLRSKVFYEKGALPADSLQFHARWRRDAVSKDFDYPILECMGRGRFVGVALFPDNILRGWWGEGDEKVYVDGEKFPSTFGTGSEDYFGDAWGIRYFENAFHGCPTREALERTRTQSVYRWHVSDNIPFYKSFKITIENYAALRSDPVKNDYSSVAYWYQAPGGADFFESVAGADRSPQGPIRPGAIEAEGLLADPTTQYAKIISDSDLPEPLSHGKGLRISGPVGTAVALNVPAPVDGVFAIAAYMAAGAKQSSCEWRLAGKPITDRVRLAKGDNRVELRLTGDPVSGDRCEVTLDYIVLEPYRHFVRHWYLIGPFENKDGVGFNTAYGPETEPFDAAKAYAGKGGEVHWKKVAAPQGLLDSEAKHFEVNDDIALYAYCEVEVPSERKTVAYVGSDDGVKVWVNGDLVHQNDTSRAVGPDQDHFDVTLKEGRNTVLVKVTQGHGPWGLMLRFNDPDEDVKYVLPD